MSESIPVLCSNWLQRIRTDENSD